MLNLGNNIPPLVEERLPGPTRENQVAVFCPELAVPLSHSSLSYMGFPSSVFFSGSFFLEGGVDSSFFSSSSQSDYFKVFSCLFFSFFSPVSSSDEMALVGVLGSEKESSCSGQLLRNTAPVAGGGEGESLTMVASWAGIAARMAALGQSSPTSTFLMWLQRRSRLRV